MTKINVKKFYDEATTDYAKERLKETNEIKKDEWKIVIKYVRKKS